MSEFDTKQFEIPRNSISCFIGRICEEPNESFESDGILWVDVVDLDGKYGSPKHGEQGTTQRKALASWTLRAAYIAWNKPPKIKFKGGVKLKGRVTMSNAQLTNVNLSGGAPMQGTALCSPYAGTATIPVAISSATGTAKIEQQTDAEIEMSTENDNLDIELTSQMEAQLPWCVSSTDAEEGKEISTDDEEHSFIKVGDLALCMAFGNSLSNLYVVDIFRV